jgi:carboxymethylenebutenolidase
MGETVSVPGAGTGYLARPDAGTGPGLEAAPETGTAPENHTAPGLVVLQEWWGLTDHIQSVVDRFAEAGFVTLAPDLYHGEVTTEPGRAGELLRALDPDRAAGEIVGAVDYLAGLPETSGETVGVVGFCMGGSLALWSATLSDRVELAVGFYPAIPWERMRPQWPEFAGKSAVIHCSEADGRSQAPGIQTARAAIEQAGGECALYDYPGTKHAFFNDDRPEVFDPDAAASAWARTLDALRTRLG